MPSYILLLHLDFLKDSISLSLTQEANLDKRIVLSKSVEMLTAQDFTSLKETFTLTLKHSDQLKFVFRVF